MKTVGELLPEAKLNPYKNRELPKIVIYEACDINLEPQSWFCYGHVELGLFAEQVRKLFHAKPSQVFHSYKRDSKRHTRDSSNNITQTCREFIPCDAYQADRVAVTVGYR